MQIFKDPQLDWLGMKWYFIAFSVLLSLAGAASLLGQTGLRFSVDFTGGTLMVLKFRDSPDMPRIRSALSGVELRVQEISRYDAPEENKVQVRMGDVENDEGEVRLEAQRNRVYGALSSEFDGDLAGAGKPDLNSTTRQELENVLAGLGAAALQPSEGQTLEGRAEELAKMVSEHIRQHGIISDSSELGGIGLPAEVRGALEEKFYLGSLTVVSSESVGPKVGSELKERARLAVSFSLLGMLVYIWFRFQLGFGVAALIALFHDVFITVGAFSLLGKEISLTVIAALLTLVGYSLNDTIVVFDRVRENQKLMPRAPLREVVNASINQTLNRTVLTSATFFLAALALYLFGGDALNGFSFALVTGVIVGTYSSIAIASPFVLWWDQWVGAKR